MKNVDLMIATVQAFTQIKEKPHSCDAWLASSIRVTCGSFGNKSESADLEVPIDSLDGCKNLHTYPLLALQILKPDNKTKSKAKPKGNL